jgi:hypothetical protein
MIMITGVLMTAGHLNAASRIKTYNSADVDWVIHLYNKQIDKTQSAKAIRSLLKSYFLEENTEKNHPFGMIYDINAITIMGKSKELKKTVVLIRGQYDKNKILAFIRRIPLYKQFEYNGIDIHQWYQPTTQINSAKDPSDNIMNIAFYNNDMIALSVDLSAVEHAYDVLKGSQPEAANDFFSNMPTQSENVFLQVISNNIPAFLGNNVSPVIFQNTNKLSLEISENENNVNGRIILTFDSKETAETMKRILDGVIAYLTLTAKKTPELIILVQQIELFSEENTITINFEMEPEMTLKVMLLSQFLWQLQ